jgi:Tfp pilus assembly protein PilN
MIVQQVNLYQDSVKQKQPDLQLYLIAAVILFCFLIGFSLINFSLIRSQHQKQELIEQKLQALNAEQTHVKLLQAKIPKQEIDTALIAQIQQWQKKLIELQQIVTILSDNEGFAAHGFSPYFQALANNPSPEVWLTGIHFDAKQQLIRLEGSTFKPDKIPYFLQQLQKEPSFHRRTFAMLGIQNSGQNLKLMKFKLSTRLEIPKKDHVQ